MASVLLKITFLLYTAAAILGLAYLYARREFLARWQIRLLAVGLVFHIVSFTLLTQAFWAVPENRYFFPINSFHGALSYLALANALVFFIVESRARLHILGSFVMPWSALAAGAAVFATPNLGPLEPTLRSFRLNLHPMMLMLAYSAFANAFGVGLAFLIQERQIKSRKPSDLSFRLPPLEELDRLHLKIISAIFPVLILGVVVGAHWAYTVWGRFTDAKVVAALITCAIYAVFLYMRLPGGMRGRRPIYMAMAGFAWILMSFVGVNYLSAQHGFLYR